MLFLNGMEEKLSVVIVSKVIYSKNALF